MGVALLELEQVLKSQYKISHEEESILQTCKYNAVRAFTVTTVLASGLVWSAMFRFGYGGKAGISGGRLGISGGAGMFFGMRIFERSLNMSEDRILSMEGSRMQTELANLILSKHQHDPWKMQLMKKHFYVEKVFDDTNQDRPISRWRFRNYFGDSATLSQKALDTDSEDNHTDSQPRKFTESQQFTPTPGIELSADPLDCVFGYSGLNEEIHHPDNRTEASTTRHTHNHKRTHRRRRVRQAEVSSDTSS